MPRAKSNTPPTVDSEDGFAALEAKVEEVQLEAAIEAELAVEDAAEAASVVMLEQAAPEDAQPAADLPKAAEIQPALGTGGLGFHPPAPLENIFAALAACTESSMRLQSDTLTSFSRVRSPADLIAAQMAFGGRAMELYTSNMARMTHSIAAFVPRQAASARAL
jgi:hypothetical protein